MRGLGCLGLARQRRWLLSWAARGVAGAAGEAVGAAAGTPTAVGGSTHTSAAASPVGPAAAQAQATLPPPAAAAPLRLQPAQPACATFLARREVVAEQLYRQYNQRVFGGKLPLDLPILWNPRLRKDAGRVETWRELEVLPGGPAGLVRWAPCAWCAGCARQVVWHAAWPAGTIAQGVYRERAAAWLAQRPVAQEGDG